MKLQNNAAITDFLIRMYERIYADDIDARTADPFNYTMNLPPWHANIEQKQKAIITSLDDKTNPLSENDDRILSIRDDRIRLYTIAAIRFKEMYFPKHELSLFLSPNKQELCYNFKRKSDEED